ncbi:glycosyltransferase family 2 protein [Chryseobacterium proteolyticum]|uniref:glycosyltransferase family 2 protein n=1 Tax=Chryseobacterium proteolyticum TaxID=118127 RepID=UPI003983CF0D
MKKLSIIIVTYNSLKDILNCIEAIYDKSDIEDEFLEIIVVDNSSADVFETMKSMIELKYGNKVRIIHNYENKGYGQGNNIGIKYALSNIVCVINPDVLLQNFVFSKILNSFKEDTRLAMIGGKQLGGINLSFWIRPEFELFIVTTPLCLLLNKLNLYFQRFFFSFRSFTFHR